jgi:hypothetical protein
MQSTTPLPDLTGAEAAPLSQEAQSMIELVAALPSCATPLSTTLICPLRANAFITRYADMNVEDARTRSERSGAAFGAGAPAGSVQTTDKMLQLPHTQLKCRVYTSVRNDTEVATPLPQALLMWAVAGIASSYLS